MTDFKDELLEVLKRDAYKKGEFKLSSGRKVIIMLTASQ